MPDHLKVGVEELSGLAMDDVKVHYNSDKPATVQALAYNTRYGHPCSSGTGTTPPHEGMDVAQQMAGHVNLPPK